MRITRRDALGFLVVSAFLGTFTDMLARQAILGLNFLLFTSIWLGVLLFGGYAKKRLTPNMWVFAGLALINAALVYVRSEPVVQLWSAVITILSLLLITGMLYASNFLELKVTQRIREYFDNIPKTIQRGVKHIYRVLHNRPEHVKKRQVSTGVALAVILGLVFIGLFSGSDAIFRNQFSFLGDFFSIIGGWLGGYNLGRFITILFWIALSGAALLAVAGKEGTIKPRSANIKQFLSKRDPEIILGTIAVIFMFFILIQLKYLFGNSGLPDGLTYANYARRGYGELLVATMLASAVIYGSIAYAKDAANNKPRAVLSNALVILNGIVVLSAWKRLSLYESAYGWTMTRFIARLGLICILIGSALLLLWVNRRITTRRLFGGAWYAVAAVLVVAALLNPVGIIVKKNISERADRETPLDVRYLNTLSPDSYRAICEHMPALKKTHPNDYNAFIKLRYPDAEFFLPNPKVNSGLSAHYTSSENYLEKYDCLK